MSVLAQLLGPKLLSKGGEVSTSEALGGKGAVALYFSAHWCPPCRGFTPKFVEWYEKDLKAKGLEVVFMSSDKDESAFKEYYDEMPWLALPYSARDIKDTLNSKYKVQGIPTIVILGQDGSVISKDGRSDISEDPTGKKFPWIPKKFSEIMSSLKFVNKDGSAGGAELLTDKVFALYFSAHWCPPCRAFTPQLAEWYSKDLKAKGLEVVFVSSDKDANVFKEYLNGMPWLALDYSLRAEKDELSKHFGIEGIPSVIIVDKDGNVINKDGRAAIAGDPIGAKFPWHPAPVGTVASDVECVNETPTVIAFCEGDAAAQSAAEAAMTPISKRAKDAAKAAGEDPEMCFLVCTESGDIPSRLRSMMGMPEDQVGAPKLMLLDIPDKGGFYVGPEGPVSTEAVQKLIADYKDKKLERKQLQS